MDNKSRRGVCVDARRGNARGEVGLDVFPEVVVLEAVDTEFPPVDCLLVVLLILVDEVKVGLGHHMCPPITLQFGMHGEFHHIVDSTIHLVHWFRIKQKLLALLGSKRERVGDRGMWKDDGFSIDWEIRAHGFQDAGVFPSFILNVFGLNSGGARDREAKRVVVYEVICV